MELNMKRMRALFLLIPAMMLFASCEDIINVTVKQKEVKLVVDAFVNNLPERQVIRITRSIPYFDVPGTEPGVIGARVAIVDTTGGSAHLFVFADSGNGNYIFYPDPTIGDTFKTNHQYVLLIANGNDTLVSFSTMEPTARLDSLHVKYEDGKTIGFRRGNYVEMFANDLPGEGNTYWIKTYRNDSFRGKIFEMNLAYDMTQTPNKQDGGQFIWPIRYGALNDFNRPWETDDTARVEIHSITLETYYYLNQVYNESLNQGLFATPPSNIPTNIFSYDPSKRVPLAGFFCMSAVSRKVLVMP
jgi:hypothetical protein